MIEPWEIFNKQGNPYQVYTSYWKQYYQYLISDYKNRSIPYNYSLSSDLFINKSELKKN